MSDPWGNPGSFSRGVARVGVPRPRVDDTTPSIDPPTPTRPWNGDVRVPVRSQLRQLRAGGEWTSIGVLFAFVCWGIWAISGGGNLAAPLLIFVLSLLVAAGLFALARLVGRVVLEQRLGRVRRSARGAHLVTAVFLAGLGIAWLQQTEWVVSAWNWISNN
jgi:hypothetical protein